MKKVNVVLDQFAKMPVKAHEDDAGYDLFARHNRIVPAGGSCLLDTGVHIAIPHGYAGLLVSKSGLNVNYGLTSTGLIDSGYTGSIVVKLYNHSVNDYPIMRGDKISQIVFIKVESPDLKKAVSLDNTERGNGGFGSTGR